MSLLLVFLLLLGDLGRSLLIRLPLLLGAHAVASGAPLAVFHALVALVEFVFGFTLSNKVGDEGLITRQTKRTDRDTERARERLCLDLFEILGGKGLQQLPGQVQRGINITVLIRI